MQHSDHTDRWRPTRNHVRACVMALSCLLLAMLLHRPDLTVIAAPFVAIAVWGLATKPRCAPQVRSPGRLPLLREGQSVTWVVRLSPTQGMQQAAIALAQDSYLSLRPHSGQLLVPAAAGANEDWLRLPVGVRSTRWGTRSIGHSLVGATSAWAAYEWGAVEIPARESVTLPQLAPFNSAAAMPHPVGLVGVNRSARRGEGNEFATIRPFQHGDRLRRIHWPVSLRTRSLHVAATHADEDIPVMLVIDATTDLGDSEGVDGAASSLDITVRAAGAVAEHFLRHGERVGLRVMGPRERSRVAPAAGQQHLRRVLYRLASIQPGNVETSGSLRFRFGFDAGTLVVMLSACISPLALQQAVVLQRQGLQVLVIDTLTPDITTDSDPALDVAWRIRRLERAMELRRVNAAGVPVVPWRGPGSLDQVLRDLGQRTGAARMAVR